MVVVVVVVEHWTQSSCGLREREKVEEKIKEFGDSSLFTKSPDERDLG